MSATGSTTSSTLESTDTSPDDEDSEGLSDGVIAGIAVGCVVALIVIITVLVLLCKRLKCCQDTVTRMRRNTSSNLDMMKKNFRQLPHPLETEGRLSGHDPEAADTAVAANGNHARVMGNEHQDHSNDAIVSRDDPNSQDPRHSRSSDTSTPETPCSSHVMPGYVKMDKNKSRFAGQVPQPPVVHPKPPPPEEIAKVHSTDAAPPAHSVHGRYVNTGPDKDKFNPDLADGEQPGADYENQNEWVPDMAVSTPDLHRQDGSSASKRKTLLPPEPSSSQPRSSGVGATNPTESTATNSPDISAIKKGKPKPINLRAEVPVPAPENTTAPQYQNITNPVHNYYNLNP